MEIIDAHAHIYERLTGYGPKGEARAIGNGMAEWANGRKERFLKEGHGDIGFSPEKLIELMDEAGVSRAVLMQACNYGLQNCFVSEAVKKYPHRFTGTGSFDPYAEKADEIFDNLVHNLGFKILKFELSQSHGFSGYHPDLSLSGKYFAPIFKKADSLGLTIVFDTGTIDTQGFQPKAISRIAKKYKNLKIVVAHTLFPADDGKNPRRIRLIKRLKMENVYFDIASISVKSDNLLKLRYIREVMDIVGADHMIWGTDCPGIFISHTYKDLIDFITGSYLFTDEELSFVFSKTARAVYNIKESLP